MDAAAGGEARATDPAGDSGTARGLEGAAEPGAGREAEPAVDRAALRSSDTLADRAAWLALRGLWAALRAAGLPASRRFLETVATAFARLDARHRDVIVANLEVAFPGIDPVLRDSIVLAAFRNWGRIGAEAVHCDALVRRSASDGEWRALAAAVGEAREPGRGLLVLTAHLGNFELLARAFGSLVAPVSVFHRPLGIARVDAFLVAERQRCGVGTLGRGASVRDAMRLLAGGGCVALPLDQNQREGRGIFVDVLGRPACTSTVLARLSLASGAPVLPVFAVWDRDRTVPVIGEAIPAPPVRPGPAGRDAVVHELTQRYAAEIDRVVRRFPHQWNWAHRRWKTRPAGEGGLDRRARPVG